MSIVAGAITLSMLGQPVVDPEQLDCMARNIYHEARGESYEGQIAVAHVTMNRVEHPYFPDSVCGVVYQNKQFSWTFMVKVQTPIEGRSWEDAKVIARDVMIGNTVDPTTGATFYHANYVNPNWANDNNWQLSKVIGLHLFYNWDGKND